MSRALRDARTRAELSKAAAADKIGVHFVTLYAWENENRTDQPSDENLAKAARVYGTTSETLQRRARAIEQGLSAEPAPSEAAENASESAAVKAPRARGRPPKTRVAQRTADAAPKAPAARKALGRPRSAVAPGGAVVTARTANHGTVTLSHQAYARVLRVLADLAEDLSLSPEALGAAQQALTAPGMLDVFAAFKSGPMTDADVLNAIDATSLAVRSFVSGRKAAGQK